MSGLESVSKEYVGFVPTLALVVLLALLMTGCASVEYAFEKARYQEGVVCPRLVGVWYNDITVRTASDGPVRHINQIRRESDGTGYIKGITFYDAGSDVRLWEFPMTWRCDGEWYTEKNEWGYTSFRIQAIGKNIVYTDERKNLGKEQYVVTDSADYTPPNEKIREYFGL